MAQNLSISIGQCSDKGRKEINQDFFGALFPDPPALALKGIAIALADGISSSEVSQIAAESAVKSLLTDYYCTSDAWTVKTSALRVIKASNSWLYAATKRGHNAYDIDRGYVCTLSAMILKARCAHIFHVGDSRIYRISGDSLEQLTTDHRTVVTAEQSYLAQAIGMARHVDIDYQAVNLSRGDIFILASDGVYEYATPRALIQTIRENPDDLNKAAQIIVEEALTAGSPDNLTIQIIRVETLPERDIADVMHSGETLPAPPLLEARQEFDGYKIIREIHANHRSHIYLAQDMESGAEVALKIPSIDLRGDKDYLARFMMEEWVAKRLNNAHVLKALPNARPRNYIYVLTEFLDGQTLSQWMIDNPKPELEVVRSIIEQIAIGLRAFHRKEMVHQDLRPENIMIDSHGTVKIIDFGATKVAGVVEASPMVEDEILGTLQYTAPECFIGMPCTRVSDLFSLGVIAYQMLGGRLPYGTQVSKIRGRSQLLKLRYASVHRTDTHLPEWIDAVLKKSLHPDPNKRFQTLSEFTTNLRQPEPRYMQSAKLPLIEKNPLVFWKVVSLCLAISTMVLLLK